MLGALLGLAGCGDAEPAAPSPATPGPVSQSEEPTPDPTAASDRLTEVEMVALMEGHYDAAIAAHDALIRGDLELVGTHLAEIPTRSLPPAAPEHWRPHELRLHEAARAADTSSLETAGPAMAAVVEACATCHVAVELGDIYRRPEPPEGEDELQTAMLRHQWATERLWEGITGPWDDAWSRGAAALAESQVFGGGGEPVSTGLRAREAALQEMGRTAGTVTGLTERSEVYGRLLATCATCHLEAGVSFESEGAASPD